MARMIVTWEPGGRPDRYIRSRMFCGNSALKLFWCQDGLIKITKVSSKLHLVIRAKVSSGRRRCFIVCGKSKSVMA